MNLDDVEFKRQMDSGTQLDIVQTPPLAPAITTTAPAPIRTVETPVLTAPTVQTVEIGYPTEIVSHRSSGRSLQLEVLWKDYSGSTWEPIANLREHKRLIADYIRSHPSANSKFPQALRIKLKRARHRHQRVPRGTLNTGQE